MRNINHRKMMKAEPSHLIPRKLAARLQLLIFIRARGTTHESFLYRPHLKKAAVFSTVFANIAIIAYPASSTSPIRCKLLVNTWFAKEVYAPPTYPSFCITRFLLFSQLYDGDLSQVKRNICVLLFGQKKSCLAKFVRLESPVSLQTCLKTGWDERNNINNRHEDVNAFLALCCF